MRSNRYENKVRIRSYEADQRDIARADVLVRMMQEAANDQMADEGQPYDRLLEDGIALLINRMDIVFLDTIYKHDNLIFQSWPCYGKAATMPRDYQVLRDGEVVAVASSQWSVTSVKEKKILRADTVDFSCYHREESNPIMEGRMRIPKDIEMKLVCEKEVMYNDIDCNKHMNNVGYLHLLQDYIPELLNRGRICYVRLHFVKEAPLGETIKVYRSEAFSEFVTEPKPLLTKKYYFETYRRDGELNFQGEIKLIEE